MKLSRILAARSAARPRSKLVTLTMATGRRSFKIAIATGMVGVALALSGCGAEGQNSSSLAAGGGVLETFPIGDRETLGPVEGDLLSGESFTSTELSGDVVVYNIWGSWCAPCREEAPILRQVASEYRDSGASFVGINVRDNEAAARAFERTYDIEYPSISTEDSAGALRTVSAVVPPSAVPSTVVVDRQGRVAARMVGAVTYSELEGVVEAESSRGPAAPEEEGR